MINLGLHDNKTVGLDLATLTETRLMIQAMSGAGKSWLIRRILEQSHGRIQQLVIDLEGEFHTLREKFDYIIAGKGGDIPADLKSVKLLAKKLLEFNASCIFDLYELKKHERIAYVKAFSEALISAPRKYRHPVLVVLDEAHLICPEKGKAESAAAVIDLATRGRKRGICTIMATQRLAKLNKDAAAELGNKMIGRTIQDIDRKRAVDELGFVSREESLALRKLQPGEFHCYGPAFRIHEGSQGYIPVDDIVLVKVGDVESSHPKIGTQHIETHPEATGKIRELIEKLEDIPQQAEKRAKDMVELKKELSALKRENTLLKKDTPAPCNHGPIIQAQKKQIRILQNELKKAGGEIENTLQAIHLMSQKIGKDVEELTEKSLRPWQLLDRMEGLASDRGQSIANDLQDRSTVENFTERPIKKLPSVVNSELSNPQRRVLQAIASFEALGIDKPSKEMVAAKAEYSPKGGAFNNLLGRLRSGGYIDYPEGGKVELTDSGREAAGMVEPIAGVEELHRGWLKIIRQAPLQKILEYLIQIYPDSISREELARTLGYAEGGGAFNNYMGRLHNTFEVIDYLPGREVRAKQEVLFPEELA